MNQNKGKHVIFLGAGASASSGYPMANRLTLLMSDRQTLIQEILRSRGTHPRTAAQTVYWFW